MKASGPMSTFPRLERVELEKVSQISGAIRNLPRCSVTANGHWQPSLSPIKIRCSSWPNGGERLWGCVSCDLRPEPVCTSNWWTEEDDSGLLQFGEPASPDRTTGLFTHPITRQNIEIPFAGCARFWVSFNFGEWFLSHLAKDFDLLAPLLIGATEEHFGVRMSQAGRALP